MRRDVNCYRFYDAWAENDSATIADLSRAPHAKNCKPDSRQDRHGYETHNDITDSG
jgi:hypothetical protein